MVFFTLTSIKLNAQWQIEPGPFVGNIKCFAATDNTIFSVTTGGEIYKSANNGTSWISVTTNWQFNAISFFGTNLYGGAIDGIYKSTNNGLNWSAVSNGLPTNTNVSCFTVNGGNVFAGTYGKGIYFSSNGGALWVAANNGLPANTSIISLASDGVSIYAGGDNGKIYYSTNNGTSWTNISTTSLSNYPINSICLNSGNIFVGTNGGGVFISNNNGLNWNPLNNNISNYNIKSIVILNNSLFAGTSSGIYSSLDSGLSWSMSNNGLATNSVSTLISSGTNICAGTINGVFLSNNSGNNWFPTGLPSSSSSNITAIAKDGLNIFAGANGNGMFVSNDNGNTWFNRSNGLLSYDIRKILINGSNIFAGTASGVELSTDNGSNWNLASNGITGAYPIVAFAVNGNNIFAGKSTSSGGSTGGIYVSSNNGGSWTRKVSGLPSGFTLYDLAVKNGTIYAATGNGIWVSYDNGNNWSSLAFPSTMVVSLAVDNSNLFATISMTNNNGIYRSINGGGFTQVYDTGSGSSAYSMVSDGTIVLAATQSGLIISNDHGTNWCNVNNGMTGFTKGIAIDSIVFSGTTTGIFSRPLSEIIPITPSITANGLVTFCQGQNVTLTSSTSTNNLWSNGSTSQSITVNTTGNYFVTHTGPSGCSISSTSIPVIVNPLPSATISISGNASSTFCFPYSRILTASTASSYLWSTGATSKTLFVNQSGTYFVTTTSNGCSVTSANIIITVNPLPSAAGIITGNTTVCKEQNAVTYTVPSITDATSYIWTLPSGATGTSNTNSITVNYGASAISGNVTLKGNNSCGDGAITTLAVTVNVKPATPTITLNGLVLQSDAPTGNQWYNQNGPIVNAVSQNYNLVSDGSYYVVTTNSNGCSSNVSKILNAIFLGVNNYELENLIFYPNPMQNVLHIDYDNEFSGKITDISGKTLMNINTKDIDVSSLSAGIYLLDIVSDEKHYVSKIVKE